MIDHVILTVSDFARSVAFYAKALKPLGITNFTDYEGHDGPPDLTDTISRSFIKAKLIFIERQRFQPPISR
jgi:catechol 2,3-dioxygenase-like lactoylglutathione lyase family enzyme